MHIAWDHNSWSLPEWFRLSPLFAWATLKVQSRRVASSPSNRNPEAAGICTHHHSRDQLWGSDQWPPCSHYRPPGVQTPLQPRTQAFGTVVATAATFPPCWVHPPRARLSRRQARTHHEAIPPAQTQHQARRPQPISMLRSEGPVVLATMISHHGQANLLRRLPPALLSVARQSTRQDRRSLNTP